MTQEQILMLWSSSMAISVTTWAILLVTALYLSRSYAHLMISSLSRGIQQGARLAAKSFGNTERRLTERNREVLLAEGKAAQERVIEREFERIEHTVQRELSLYPHLHRQLSDVVTRIDEDYSHTAEVRPSVPGWEKAVEAVARVPSKGDPMVANILENIHTSMVSSHERALKEYRGRSQQLHNLLKRMMPSWRKVQSTLQQVDGNVNSLINRSREIDRHMDAYDAILRQEDRAMRMLSSSSLTQFFIATFVLMIAIGGAMINFNLIAHPMQEMVGASGYIMGFKTSNIAALVIILVEVAMGLFLMESLRITRLFPVIGAMSDKMRIRMVWITFMILLVLASIESGLAYMREVLAQDDAALRASLLGGQGVAIAGASYRWITTAAQMGMGFILPFALIFVAIPLESFVHSSRTVIGVLASAVLRLLMLVAHMSGNMSIQIGHLITNLYDIVICVPLWLEKIIKRRAQRHKQTEHVAEHVATETLADPVATQGNEVALPDARYRNSGSSIMEAQA